MDTAEANVKEIRALVEFFCLRVQEKKPAFISLEYREGELKYFLNNASAAPHSRHKRRQTQQPTTAPHSRNRRQAPPQPTAAPNRHKPPPCTTHVEPVTISTPATTPPAPPGAPPTAGAPTETMADNTRAKKKRKANNGSPPTSTPEVLHAGQ